MMKAMRVKIFFYLRSLELTLDFDNAESFEHHHYALHVSDSEFDTILQRVQEARAENSHR
jgi:hypothetical protein